MEGIHSIPKIMGSMSGIYTQYLILTPPKGNQPEDTCMYIYGTLNFFEEINPCKLEM